MPVLLKYLFKTYFPAILFIMAGMGFIILPWLMMFSFMCYRVTANQGKCVVRQTFLGIPTQEISLSNLLHAEQKSSFGGRSSSYWVVLQTSNGKINLPKSSISKPVSDAVIQINSFLADPNQKYFTVTQSERLYGFYLGIFFIGGGMVTFWIMRNQKE